MKTQRESASYFAHVGQILQGEADDFCGSCVDLLVPHEGQVAGQRLYVSERRETKRQHGRQSLAIAARGGASGTPVLPAVLDTAGSVVRREVVCQDDSQQLEPHGVVFAVWVGASESFVNEAAGIKMCFW